jgi:hypothetical protein
MRYLEAVRWSAEDESAIRSCVASLQLQVSPELAFRLCSLGSLPENCSPADLMGEVLDELLTEARIAGHARARDLTTSVLLANAQATSSPAFAAVNEIALQKELQTSWERLKIQLNSTNMIYIFHYKVNRCTMMVYNFLSCIHTLRNKAWCSISLYPTSGLS